MTRQAPGCAGLSWPHSSTSSSHAGIRPRSYPMECETELVLGEAHAGNPHVQALGLKCWAHSKVDRSVAELHHTQASPRFVATRHPFRHNTTPFLATPLGPQNRLCQAGLFQAQGIPAILNAIRSAADTRHHLPLRDCSSDVSLINIASQGHRRRNGWPHHRGGVACMFVGSRCESHICLCGC